MGPDLVHRGASVRGGPPRCSEPPLPDILAPFPSLLGRGVWPRLQHRPVCRLPRESHRGRR